MYTITRQSNYYDSGAFSVEIASCLDNVSPGALASHYAGDFAFEKDPREAAEVAITLRKEWVKGNPGRVRENLTEGTLPFTISGASMFGLYPTVADGLTAAGLRRWAKLAYTHAPKCDNCGEVCEKAENYWYEFGDNFTACDDSCADRFIEKESEFCEELNAE